jgi:hypothetical protein
MGWKTDGHWSQLYAFHDILDEGIASANVFVFLLFWGNFLGQDLIQKFEKLWFTLDIICNL